MRGFTAFCWFIPHCSHSYHTISWQLSVLVQQPQVLLHTYYTYYHIPPNTIVSGVANVEALVPTILHLQTQDKCKHSTILQLPNHKWFYFTWSTTHISSALTHHIHNIKCLWFWFQLLQYHYCNNCVEGTNYLIQYSTWQAIMSLPVGSPVLTYCSGCDMDLLAVGNCPQMRCNVNNTVSWSNCVATSCATDYMQTVMYTTGVVLKIPVQCSCS